MSKLLLNLCQIYSEQYEMSSEALRTVMMNNEEVRGAACPLQSLKKHTPYHECTWFREKENFQNSSTRLEYRKPRRESKTICFPNFFAIVKVLPVFQFVIYPSFFLLSNHNLEFSMKKKIVRPLRWVCFLFSFMKCSLFIIVWPDSNFYKLSLFSHYMGLKCHK